MASAALDRALDEERLRSVRVGLKLRGAGSLAYLAHALAITALLNLPSARAVIPAALVYAGAAWLLILAVRLRPSLALPAIYTIPLIDMPCIYYAVSRAMLVAPPALAPFQAGSQMGAYLMFLVYAQMALDRRYVVVTAATGLLLELWLLSRVGLIRNPQVVSIVGIMAFATTFVALYVPGRFNALLRRVVDESEARVREVQVLNDELRRQIGDRAGQLALALSRLEPSRAQAQALSPGSVVEERYRVLRHLGTGGMGAVYEVERVADGKRLALKVLLGGADREALARFAREAQIAAQLDHPNLIGILDVDVTASGLLYLVMELVAGSTLEAERARFGEARWAVPLLAQVASALAAMHARGIVHRDLKPSNVLLDGATAKVGDFGIASLLADDTPDLPHDARATPPMRSRLTRTGVIMGTPSYMAPELTRGAREATPASDVFSLGVLAFELLTARLPHAASPVLENLLGRAAASASRLGELRGDLPPALSQCIDQCLSPEVSARPTAEAMAGVLISFRGEQLPERPVAAREEHAATPARTRIQ